MGWGGNNASNDLHKGITTQRHRLSPKLPRGKPPQGGWCYLRRERLQGVPPMDGATAPFLQLRKRNFSLTLSLADASVQIWGVSRRPVACLCQASATLAPMRRYSGAVHPDAREKA